MRLAWILRKQNNLRLILIPGLLLALVFLLFIIFFNFFFQLKPDTTLAPAKYLEIDEAFSGQLYFNNEMGTNIFSDLIIKGIDEAQESINLAVYSMDDTRIRAALYRAAERGVDINLIFSDKRKVGHDQIFKDLPENIKRQDIPSAPGSMHHKFLLIDQNTPQVKLFFGSYNFTYLQEKYDPCFLLQTTRPEIAVVFGEEFERLKNGYHGQTKLSNPFAAKIKYQDGFLEIWFMPQDDQGGLKERMIGLVKGTNNNVKALIWNFTDYDLASELAVLAREKTVQIITDDYNYNYDTSVFKFLATEKIKRKLDKLEVITDLKRNQEIKNNFQENNLNSFLHHHLLLIDDSVAVFGTNNWSTNGFYNNDESVMISDIDSLVSGFRGVWEFNYNKNK